MLQVRRDIANRRETISLHRDVQINSILALDHFHAFFLLVPTLSLLMLTPGSNSFFYLGSVSFVFCQLLCFLPLLGIKLRGGGLSSRGFSNYMFNLSFRPSSRPGDFPAWQVTRVEEEIPP